MSYFTPTLFNSVAAITTGVTYASRGEVNEDHEIPGLNFGDNTGISLSAVKENIGFLESQIGKSSGHALAEQVHNTRVRFVKESGYYSETDALITDQSDLLIGIRIADCAAILMYDPVSGIIAATHAGWRGAAGGIAGSTVDEMKKKGANITQTKVYISPCISVENFEIGEEVAGQFPTRYINRNFGIKPHLDLKSYLFNTLIEYGIRQENVELDERCTIDDTSFYSYRRERDHAGRMLAFIRKS